MNLQTPIPLLVRGAACVVLLGVLAQPAGADGLVEVTQTVFGMDCAPCAHGVRKNLMKLDGVSAATVSLNDGYARVELLDDSSITLRQIREVIRENGFTPKGAKLIVAGSLSRVGDRPILTFADQEFRLAGSPAAQAAWQELLRLASGVQVRVEGQVDESDPGRIVVSGVAATE